MPPHRPRSVARRTVYGSKSSGLAGQDRELWDTSLLGVTRTTTTARGVEMPSTILQSLPCPCCKKVLSPGEPGTYAVRPAGSFAECLRRCAVCGIGFSNSSTVGAETIIYKNPHDNVPEEFRAGFIEAIRLSVNKHS